MCAYKGTASYWSVTADGRTLTDAVWSFPRADGDAAAVSGYLSFRHHELVIETDQAHHAPFGPNKKGVAGHRA